MKSHALRSFALIVGTFAMLGPALGFKQGDFGADKNHQLITESALGPAHITLPNWARVQFAPDAIADISKWNQYTDTGYLDPREKLEVGKDPDKHFWDSKYHFDEDNFTESSDLIFRSRREIIGQVLNGSGANARKLLGQTLHTIQDFYAHSNWVEKKIANPLFPHPDWAASEPFEGPNHAAFNEFGKPGDSNIATCTRTDLLSAAPLTTGYYDIDMSPPIPTDLGAYTNEWRTNLLGLHLSWPANHCVHGGDGDSSGLNKDDNKRGQERFDVAMRNAMSASAEFVRGILNRIAELAALGANDAALKLARARVCEFLGQPESQCTPRITGVTLSPSMVTQGEVLQVTVTGWDIPPTAEVQFDSPFVCGPKSDASIYGFTMWCRPGGDPGMKRLTVAFGPGGIPQWTGNIDLLPAGRLTFLPAELTSDGISSWSISGIASWVKQVTWKFGGDMADVIVNVQNGMVSAVQAFLKLPGVREVFAVLDNGFGDEGVTLKTTATISQGATVTAFEAVGQVIAGQPAAFLLKGTKLPDGLVVSIQDCGIATEIAQGATDLQRQFACTFPATAVAGSKSVGVGPVGSQGSPFEKALASGFAINLVKATVTGVSASPTPMPRAASLVAVIGSNLPSTAVVLVIDATCDRSTVIAKPDGTGFTQSCTFGPAAGIKAVQVMSASDASGFVIDDSKTLTVGAVQPSSTVADTGVASCTDYAFSPFSLVHTVGLDCALSQDSQGDPVPPRQDGATGRDALAAKGLLEKIGSGPGGFDFTKLDASGAALPAAATNWACVRDNHTKLVWENKASDGGLRDYRHRYTWYFTAADANGGYAGSLGSNTCGGTLGAACNTQAYVTALNAAQLCGGSSWRLPKLEELRSIVNFGRVNPSIDAAWFSNTAFIPSIPGGSAVGYWSSNVYSANPTFGVMGMEFSYGLLMTPGKSSLLAARAVMSAN